MNPFHTNDLLTVHFGTPQRWRVERVSDTHCAMRFPGLTCAAVKWFSVTDLQRWNPDHAVFKSQRTIVADDRVYLAGSVNAWCVVLWIGDAYETRPWPNAPAHVVEYVRQSVLRNTQTGKPMIYPFRDSTADGRLRVREAG